MKQKEHKTLTLYLIPNDNVMSNVQVTKILNRGFTFLVQKG